MKEPTIKPAPIPDVQEEPKEEELEIKPPVDDESHLPPWRRGKKAGPKREIPKPAEPEAVEQIKLKPTPKQKKELPQEALEEVTLKPVPKKPEVEEVAPQEAVISEFKEIEVIKPKKTKAKKEIEPLEPLTFPEIPASEPVQLEAVEKIVEEKPQEPEPSPEQPSWRRTPKPKQEPEEPEEKKWPTGKRRPLPEEPKEEVVLKPIPKPQKQEEPKPSEDLSIKPKPIPAPEEEKPEPTPWRRGKKEKPVEEEPDEKKWPTGKRRPLEETPAEEVVLKPIPKPKKEEEPQKPEKVTLKPVESWEMPKELEVTPSQTSTVEDLPKPAEIQEQPTPWRRGKKEKPVQEEEETKEWPKGKRRPLEEQPQEEVVLKPIPKPTKEEEPKAPESVELKPKESPSEVPEEKPQPTPWRRGKKEIPKEPEPEVVKLKPTPKQKKVDETPKEEVVLKPVPRQEAIIEDVSQPIELKQVTEVKVEVEEQIVTKTKRRVKKPKKPQEQFATENIALMEEAESFDENEELPHVAETIADVVPEEVLELIPEEIPLEKPKKRKSRTNKHVVFREELSTYEIQPEQVQEDEEDEELEIQQEVSQTSIQLKPVEVQEVKLQTVEPVPMEEIIEEQTEFRKEMEVKIQSNIVKKEKRRVFVDDSQPLPELEIITQKRVQEVTDKVAEENVREEQRIVESTQQTIAETKIQEQKIKIKKPKVKPPNIIKKLQPQICEPDQPVVLQCQIEGVPFPDVKWYFNDTVLFANPEYLMNIVEDVATLEIATVQPYHVGIYTCEAKNVAGVAISKANIVVQEKPEIGEAPMFVEPLKIEVNESKTVAIVTCKVHGIPKPTVKWFKEEEEIIETEEIETVYIEETGHVKLTVQNPKQNLPVVYTIIAENKFGKAVGKANLFIQSIFLKKPKVEMIAPQIVQPLEAQVVKTGSTLVFECRFTGVPKPTVKWFRNSKEIVEEEEITIVTEEYYSRIVVTKITKKNVGRYEIVVQNEAGQAKSSATVIISDTSEMDEAKAPRFVEPLVPKLVAEAEVCILEAVVDSYPTSTFQWFHEGAAIKSSNELRIVTDENKSILIIESFNKRDVGVYTCRAENVAGSVISTATIQVLDTVETEEVTEYISPRFIESIKPTRVMDGEKLILACQVHAAPLPKVQWYHNQQQIIETKDKQIHQDSTGRCVLTISEVFPEDTGEYTCIASNKLGEAVCKTSVNVEPFEYVADSEQFRSSEEDLLTDKSISTLEEYAEPIEFAPQIIKELPRAVMTQEREMTKLEVKVLAQPKAQIRWLKANEEIIPSDEFQIENFEDGTSILIINDIYPDDSGTISFEAHNALGVAQTTTELVVEEIVGTKMYRKPEWVQYMEDMKEALKAAYATPSFSLEIKDSRAMLGERGYFECHFAGNPKPDILWYRNGKIVIANERVKIRTEEHSSTLTIYPVEVEDFGFYKCRAMSDAGSCESIAKLIESTSETLTEEERTQLEELYVTKRNGKNGKNGSKKVEKVEVVVEESEEVIKKKMERKSLREQKREEKKQQAIEEVVKKELETSVEKKVKFSQESTSTLTTSTTSELQQDVKITHDTATVKFKEHRETLIEEVITTETVKEFEHMIITEKLDVSDVESVKHSVQVNEILTNLKAADFGPGEVPLRELATIAYMVKHGVTVNEISSFYQSDHFPALKAPESQSALVLLLEREGYASIVTEILTETDMDEAQVAATAGFRAFMRMIEMNHTSVEEIITHFSPEDFFMHEWKLEQADEKFEETQLISSSEVRTTETTVMTKKELEIKEEDESIAIAKQKTQKQLKPLKPLLPSEEEMLDEMAVEFLRSPTRETKELPIGIAQIMNLSSSLDTVTNIERSEPMRSSASIEIVPQKSMTTEETLISEKEYDTLILDSSKLSTVPKYNLIGLNESVQVSEVLTEELPQETHESKPTAQLAKTELIPTQSLQVSESMTHDSASELQPFSSVPSSAKVELYTHDAKIVQETISNQSEENLTLPQAPIASKAHAQVLSKESVEITEVNRIEKEETFDGHIKLPSVVPKYQFLPSESIQTSETVAEDSPSKFYPELAVPTETARKVFVEQKSYTTHVLNAPEKEDVYVPGRLPPQQKADILLYTTEPLQIAEQPTQEHETEFSAALKPTTCNAVDTLATHESLTTETINENYCTKPFESDTFETKTATVDFRERTTVSISNIISNETESELAPFELASSARALPSLSTLSIGQSELPFVHEKETQHLGVPRPNEATAEFSLEPIENLAVTEIETADAAGRFSPEAQERTETASTAYVLQQSHVVSAVQANEKEYEFEGKTDQKPAFAETQLDVQNQLEVISHQISERETLFQAPQMPSDHVAKSTPTDIDQHEQTTVSETMILEDTAQYEAAPKPDAKLAERVVSPIDELIVTEVNPEQKEREGYDVAELARENVAQAVPSHTLKTVVVEEVQPSDSF
ncbi:hypothetical protein pipiens_005861, partial [Culex pipiens pipiens]